MLLLEIEDFKNIKNLNGNIISDEILKYIGNLLKYIFEDSVIGRINTNKFVVFMKNNNKEDIEVQISEFYLRVKDFQEIYIPCNIGACLSNKSNYLKMYSACNKALYNLKNIENGENLVYWNNLILDENYEHFKTKLINNKENKVKNYNNINQLVANEGDSIAYVIDCFNYKIVDGNDAFFKMLNKTKEECINIECYKLIHNRERPCNLCKSIFWNSTDFFVWNQYNKVLNKDFLLKNKLVLFNQKKCMFTLATSISLVDERKNDNINQDISRSIVSAISHLSKKYNYEDNINFILELICSLYKSEFGFVFEIDKNDHISTHSLTKTSLSYDIKSKLSEIISDEFLSNPINNVRVLNGQQEVISVSYNLYNIMIKFHLYNMLIIPIINNKNHIGYIICLNNNKIEESIYYDKIEEYSNNISYFISEEIIKNTLKMELNFEKNYDNLTGVLNRNAYRSYEMAYDADNIKNIGVLCLALNELNSINHTAGVLAGDQVLLNLAEILKTQFYHKPIFRLNGNEFLIIMKNIKYELFLEEIEILSKSLEKVGLSMTYGKVWSSDEKELSYLVNSSIYFRKMESNKGRELITNNIYKRNTLFTELMLAIESNEYEIFLQPKISLKNDKLYGAEALIRKKNPEGGYIPPDKFIPILEHHYLIQYIDLFVFEEVCKLLQSWQNENKPLIPISLNFSRRTLLQEDIIKMVLDIKNKYNIDYKYVEVEVTESIGDLEKQAICIVLKDIEKMGISILLDDFGVKYSNLTILSEIDFDGLKLDKTMVKNLGQNTTNEIIMKNIISMCKDLNIKTTAEGVETIEQENILREMNCDIVQGYLHSKPLPVSEFLENFYNKNIE